MSRFTRRWRLCTSILLTFVVAAAVWSASVGAAGRAKPTSGTIWIGASARSTPGLLYVAGQVQDKVLGAGAVTFTIKPVPDKKGGIDVNAIKVTLWTPTGSLTGTGGGRLIIENTKTGASRVTDGTVSLTKGTGAQKGHSFKATFAGSGNINGSVYTFKYKGTYK